MAHAITSQWLFTSNCVSWSDFTTLLCFFSVHPSTTAYWNHEKICGWPKSQPLYKHAYNRSINTSLTLPPTILMFDHSETDLASKFPFLAGYWYGSWLWYHILMSLLMRVSSAIQMRTFYPCRF